MITSTYPTKTTLLLQNKGQLPLFLIFQTQINVKYSKPKVYNTKGLQVNFTFK